MSGFSFSFDLLEENDAPVTLSGRITERNSSPKQEKNSWYDQCKYQAEHSTDNQIRPIPPPSISSSTNYHEISIRGVKYRQVGGLDRSSDSMSYYNLLQTDLVNGEYEGGYKIWECSLDLVDYLYKSNIEANLDVLELGCGHGFPGICSMMYKKCRSIVFSDFNDSVLIEATWPNIIANIGEQGVNIAQCYGGDWMALSNLFTATNRTFDLIVSAETLYSLDSCEKVKNIF